MLPQQVMPSSKLGLLIFVLMKVGSIHCHVFKDSDIQSQGLSSTIPNSEGSMSAEEIIIERGYHAESHLVTTEDGYILMIHRIPYPKGRSYGPTGLPVFLHHGIAESSADWLLLPSNKSLAFQLADLGYDVWLGNCRGNTYSRGHVTLDASRDKTYWDFSFDEMGRYDLPAAFNHILGVTKRETLVYIGFSMGTTIFFVCMDYHPEWNGKIEMMVALAPVGTLAYSKSILRLLLPIHKPLSAGLLFYGMDIMSSDSTTSQLEKKICLRSARFALLCRRAFFLIQGPNIDEIDLDIFTSVIGQVPAGISVRTIVHFLQNGLRNYQLNPKFDKFDYGWFGNRIRYGQPHPPAYNLSKVTVPVYMFHGVNDILSSSKGVDWLVSRLPDVRERFFVDNPKFNHLDFMFNGEASRVVYNPLIELLSAP